MIAIDTNLLIYAHRANLMEHDAAKRAIEAAAAGTWAIPLPCVTEFWAIATHPRSQGRASRPEEAASFIRNLIEAGARIILPGRGFHEELLRRACELNLHGPRIFDLQIAVMAHAAGAREIWTHDRNFVTIPGLKKHDPITVEA